MHAHCVCVQVHVCMRMYKHVRERDVNAVYEAGGANLMKFRLLTSFENLDFNLVISGVYLSILFN